jgi:hypothetical protein
LPIVPGWPVIGNLLDLNVEYLYRKCNDWAHQYGRSFLVPSLAMKFNHLQGMFSS